MNRPYRWMAACVVGLCTAMGAPAVDLGATFTASLDDTGGQGIDADFTLSPTENLTLRALAGYSTGPEEVGDLAGTVLGGGISLHGEHFGVTLDYDHFEDPTSYRVGTLAARAWFDAGDLRLSLLGRQRDMRVALRLDLPLQVVRRDVEFSALGAGLELTWTRGDFGAYLMALDYEYDEAFERFVALDDGPLSERRPRIEALLGSFIMQAQGAIDSQGAVGMQYSFGRQAVALDVSTVHDAIIDESSTSYMLSWQRVHSARLDFAVSAGIIDSISLGNVGFMSLTLGVSN